MQPGSGAAPPPGAHILKGLNTLRALEATPQRCQTEPRSLPGEAAPRASWTSRGTCLPSRFRSLFPNAFTIASFGGDARFFPYGTSWNTSIKSKCGPRSKYIQNLSTFLHSHLGQPAIVTHLDYCSHQCPSWGFLCFYLQPVSVDQPELSC